MVSDIAKKYGAVPQFEINLTDSIEGDTCVSKHLRMTPEQLEIVLRDDNINMYVGEEAVATGVCKALEKEDYIASTHRCDGHLIAKGADINAMMAELMGKLNKEGFKNAVKHKDNGMLRVLLIGYANEQAARADMAIVRATDNLYSGSWLKHF